MKVSRGVEQGVKPSVEDLAVDRYRCQESVEVQKHWTQDKRLNRSAKCQEAIEEAEAISIDPAGVKEQSGLQ